METGSCRGKFSVMKETLTFSERGVYDEKGKESAFFGDGSHDCHKYACLLAGCTGGGDTGRAGRDDMAFRMAGSPSRRSALIGNQTVTWYRHGHPSGGI
ncbi:MAG: hypothetical protein ACLRZN_00555 [Dialister invisus]